MFSWFYKVLILSAYMPFIIKVQLCFSLELHVLLANVLLLALFFSRVCVCVCVLVYACLNVLIVFLYSF